MRFIGLGFIFYFGDILVEMNIKQTNQIQKLSNLKQKTINKTKSEINEKGKEEKDENEQIYDGEQKELNLSFEKTLEITIHSNSFENSQILFNKIHNSTYKFINEWIKSKSKNILFFSESSNRTSNAIPIQNTIQIIEERMKNKSKSIQFEGEIKCECSQCGLKMKIDSSTKICENCTTEFFLEINLLY